MDPHIRAQELIRCDLCNNELVQIHCDTCHVKLCNVCIGEHMESDESNKKHEIVRFIFRKSIPLYPQCTFHDKERCEMYCNQCDLPICITCIASDQHSSHNMSTILQILDERKDKIIKANHELNDTILPTYQDISSDVENAIKQLEKEYGDISAVIINYGEEWLRRIRKVVKMLTAQVDEMKTQQLEVLQEHLDKINETISQIRDGIKSTDVAKDSYDISEVLSITLNVDKYTKLPKKIVSSSPTFTPEAVQLRELCSMFGTISSGKFVSQEDGYSIKKTQNSSEDEDSPPVKQLLKKPKIIATINTEHGLYLHNVACLSEEEIWTSGDDSTMNFFSFKLGSLLKSITTKSGNMPYDITVTKHGHLVYTDPNEKTVNIVTNEETEAVIRLQKWEPYNICSTSSGDLLVVMECADNAQSKIVRFSGSTKKQSIQFDDKNQPLYSFGLTKYISENKNMDICVSDWVAGEVVVVNQTGKLRFRYTGHTPALNKRPFRPRGITIDSESHILTAVPDQDSVHVIDQDGQFLCFIDSSHPWGLCTDTNDNLFVAQCKKMQVKKIKFLR